MPHTTLQPSQTLQPRSRARASQQTAHASPADGKAYFAFVAAIFDH